MQTLWKSKLDQDEPVSDDISSAWNKLKADLNLLSNVSFKRQAYDDRCDLIICCDASKNLSGFNCYANGAVNGKLETNLIFAKSKNAPTKTKSLPTLELLSVFLAFKCLDSILNAVTGKIDSIIICVDAQIVLPWILSSVLKVKKLFASNRVKDIS